MFMYTPSMASLQLSSDERKTILSDEEFRAQTTKAILDLQNMLAQVLSRQLALEALGGAMLGVVHPAALPHLRDEFDEEIVRLATLLAPKHQRPEYWEAISSAIEGRIKSVAQPPEPGWKAPGAV